MQTILIRVERDKDKYQHRGRTTLYLCCTRCAQIQIVEE